MIELSAEFCPKEVLTETETDRQRQIQADSQRDRLTDRHRQVSRETYIHTDKQAERHIQIQTNT